MVYLGSKNKISKDIVPIIQSFIDDNTVGYLEPFVGGANVIDKIKCKKKIGCDIHKQLIELLKKVRDDVDNLPQNISIEEYNEVKNNKEKYPDWYVGLVGFCATFGAKYFGGYAREIKGEDKSNAPAKRINNLRKQSKNLQGIKFLNCNFLDLPKEKIKGYVIYCDIPYRGTTKYKTEKFPYEEFYCWVKEMAKDNIVLISEYNMPDEFQCIWKKDVKTSLDCNKKNTNRVEKLFLYKVQQN